MYQPSPQKSLTPSILHKLLQKRAFFSHQGSIKAACELLSKLYVKAQ